MPFRYKNIELECMRKVTRETNKDGNIVIYVEECNKFEKKHWKYYETLDNT